MGCVSQLVEGRVKNVSAAAAGELLADGFVLLDVRPPEEISKVQTEYSGTGYLAATCGRSFLFCLESR